MAAQTAVEVKVRRLTDKDWPLLERMYATFTPLAGAKGLPPPGSTERSAWLNKLAEGINLVAFVEDRLAGHLVLLPVGNAAELTCFVHQGYRRRGLATSLTQTAVEEARAAGFRRVFVFIDTHNVGARRGLLKFGFRPVWEDLEEGEYVYRLG